MKKTSILLILLLYQNVLSAQIQPLTKDDSNHIFINLEKYEYLMRNNDLRSASGAMNDIAYIYWNKNHYPEAVKYYEKSLTLNIEVGNENGIAMINNNLGMLYFDIGNLEKSLSCFNNTLASRRSKDESIGIISAEINMSVVLNNLQRYDESIKLLSEALDIARSIFNIDQMRSVYGMLSETYQKKGDLEKSFKYFELYKSFHEQMKREEVKQLNKQLSNEQEQKTSLLLENELTEIELLKKEVELLRQDEIIEMKDAANQELYTNLTKQEIALQLLERERELGKLESLAKTQKNYLLVKEKKILRIIYGIGLFVALLICALIYGNWRKTKLFALRIKEKNLTNERHKKELTETNDLKNKIFSIISHDLRSPISSLQNFFIAIDGFEMEDELKQALRGVESQLSNSATLLENLLSWSRSQIENANPIIEHVNLSELVDETFSLLQFQAVKKQIQLISHVSNEDTIATDRSMVNIVLRNVIQNAVKFTPDGGVVTVRFVIENGRKCIKVEDTGVGMSEKKIAELFNINTNRSSIGTAKEKGSGLGMILCKELIAKVNGSIEVSSKLGVGTVFVLKF
jgi:two-component system, sensor histidine kinase and response regulator